MRTVLCWVIYLYLLAIFARAIMSWFRPAAGGPVAAIRSGLYTVTEPVLGPLRRVIPPARIGGASIDLSVIVVLLVARIVIIPIVC